MMFMSVKFVDGEILEGMEEGVFVRRLAEGNERFNRQLLMGSGQFLSGTLIFAFGLFGRIRRANLLGLVGFAAAHLS